MEKDHFICEQCGNSYKQKRNLSRHISEQHSKVKDTFICKLCNKEFARKYQLQRHYARYHKLDEAIVEFTMDSAERNQVPDRPYVTVKSDMYEDITSDEDDADFGNLDVDQLLCEIQKDMSDEKLQELNTFVDDILKDWNAGGNNTVDNNNNTDQMQSAQPVNCDDNNYVIDVPVTSSQCEDHEDTIVYSDISDTELSDEEILDTQTTTVVFTMQRKTYNYKDGNSCTERNLDISYSENINPNRVNYSGLVEDIFNEVPIHLHQLQDRHMHGNYEV